MAQFPDAAPVFATRSNGATIDASHVNDLQTEVTAIGGGYVGGTARLNSSNSTVANLSVAGGSTLAGALTAGASTFATLSVSGGSTFAGPVTFSTTVSFSTTAVPTSTFTPTDGSGAGLSLSTPVGMYLKLGQWITAHIGVTYPATANGANAVIGGFPAAAVFTNGNYSAAIGFTNNSIDTYAYMASGGTTINLVKNSGGAITNAEMSGRSLYASITYRTAG